MSPEDQIEAALKKIQAMSRHTTDGKWLEHLTSECALLIAEWDIKYAWSWDEWPDRKKYYRKDTDLGIDVVALRRSDGEYVAIQCKSRRLSDDGTGPSLTLKELATFMALSADKRWAERWVVTNGNVGISDNANPEIDPEKPLKLFNLKSELLKHREVSWSLPNEVCPHCESGGIQTRDCMQAEAVGISVRTLQETANSTIGRARGRIILPCGTGKSRIALRIIEELTQEGEISAVLCPSIALVAQLRREFLTNSQRSIRAIAVCSDTTAGSGSDLSSDPTLDVSQTTASEVKGLVTTDSSMIAEWMDEVVQDRDRIGVIFSTYQSSHQIAAALAESGQELCTMIADEAHRTAGLRRIPKLEKKLRDFTVCHDEGRFPAKFRIYQTATPRVYNLGGLPKRNDKWIVRTMDDQSVFGVELYRKSYVDAVTNKWLSDYRIIALGVNDEAAFSTANNMAAQSGNKLSTTNSLRGLALALVMGGALRQSKTVITSSINFVNTIKKSKEMTRLLQSQDVRNWVQRRLDEANVNEEVADYRLEHLDAKSKVAAREEAKARLAMGTEAEPYGVINVGIFGEGTDAPSLSAVGFLEARKSPIDVIQAVGRVMRRSPNKKMGYIICPIVIPPGTDAETWLRTSSPEDGWKELGQILVALRAHDSRIEDELSDLIKIYIPSTPPENVITMVTLGREGDQARHYVHNGKPGEVENDVVVVLNGDEEPKAKFTELGKESQLAGPDPERIISGRLNKDTSIEIREDGIKRDKAQSDGTPGPINIPQSKKKGKDMLNGKSGRIIQADTKKKRTRNGLFFSDLFSHADKTKITVNLLQKSGLVHDRAERDVNILRDSIKEATEYFRQDELGPELDRHFRLDDLDDRKRRKQADGCTIAALLLMNAALLHQRIAAGRWLPGVDSMDKIKNSVDAFTKLYDQWSNITRYDFLPVMDPAIDIIRVVRDSGRLEGLNRVLRHLASEAERIAESYADLGADHAGPLFNDVMGNQASDGAYFTRPPAASLLARLILDVSEKKMGRVDWTLDKTWKDHRTTDLACGSGTLLAGVLTEMKRRAKECGANTSRLGDLQKLAVEEVISGLDINPVSLQLAAAQLIAGNHAISYRKMRLHKVPYGPHKHGTGVAVGSLELLGQGAILPRPNDLHPDYEDRLESKRVQLADSVDPILEDSVKAVKSVQLLVMNPPFTNRSKMGEKYPSEVQKKMRNRTDSLEATLSEYDPDMLGFADKNSIGPLFVALADKCLNGADGVLAMINPTIAITTTSGHKERVTLAQRFHIHTILTSHVPDQINLSQNTNINESIVVARRFEGTRPPTQIISLDRFPLNEGDVGDFHRCLSGCTTGLIPGGWGEVSEWPVEQIEKGDWSAVVWRHPYLAKQASKIANMKGLTTLRDQNMNPAATGQELRAGFKPSVPDASGSFPILKSKGAEGQIAIKATPDEHWIPKQNISQVSILNDNEHPKTAKILKKAGYLLITAGQDISTARLTAVASDVRYVGNGWMPVANLTADQAKAAAVFLNSTAGRLQIMRVPGRKLQFLVYSARETANLRVPDLSDEQIVHILADCWQRTAGIEVPQFRDGECEVRRLWDESVAMAVGWDVEELSELRHLLHREPFVRGFGYNQYG